MKKTLLFAGITALCVSEGAFCFSNDSDTYPVFDSVNSTYPYASKKQLDGTVKIKHATTNYVQARATEAQGLVDELSGQASRDTTVINANTEALSGKSTQNEWADKGMDTNRQVKTEADTAANGQSECSQANLGVNYSGCGYIAKQGSSVPNANNYQNYSQDSDDYQWVKIITNCAVEGQSNAPNCVSGNS